jgi:hypothetical protein
MFKEYEDTTRYSNNDPEDIEISPVLNGLQLFDLQEATRDLIENGIANMNTDNLMLLGRFVEKHFI